MSALQKTKVLFIAAAQSNALLAQALLQQKSLPTIDAYYFAGHEPAIDNQLVNVMKQFDLQAAQTKPLSLTEAENQQFDYVIHLSSAQNSETLQLTNTKHYLTWQLSESNFEQQLLLELDSRINTLLTVLSFNHQQSDETTEFDSISFYKCLTDNIRLNTLMLTHYHGELCVCELMFALQEDSQPKVSRNLAVLKKANILSTRKAGQWVYYRINPALPPWVKRVIAQTTEHNVGKIIKSIHCLATMQNRPNKNTFCS